MSFEEVKAVFLDPMHISRLDHRFDYFEERWITLFSPFVTFLAHNHVIIRYIY